MFESVVSGTPARGPRECRVTAVDRLTADSVSVLLKDVSGAPFEFEPGQFFMITFQIDGQTVRRTYSATNAPGEFGGGLRLGVKRRPGGLVSGFINDRLKPGDIVLVKGPGGKLVPSRETDGGHLVLVAAGSGVTPMISIVRSLALGKYSGSATLIYCNRDPAEVMFASELADIEARSSGRFKVASVYSSPPAGWTGLAGRLDSCMLRAILGDIPVGDEFLVCGSPQMMETARRELVEAGVDPAAIRTETFNVPEDI